MSELNKPEEKPSEVESTSHLSEEQLEQVAGGVPKGQQQYLQYKMTEVLVSSVSVSAPTSK